MCENLCYIGRKGGNMFTRDDSGIPPFLTLFFAVFFGALLAMLAHDGITELRMRYAIHEAEEVVKKSLLDAEASLDRQQLLAQQQRDAAAQSARVNASANALATRLQREREERKAVAWDRFFQPSAACKLDSGLAKCANEHIAARKRFEDIYVDR